MVRMEGEIWKTEHWSKENWVIQKWVTSQKNLKMVLFQIVMLPESDNLDQWQNVKRSFF